MEISKKVITNQTYRLKSYDHSIVPNSGGVRAPKQKESTEVQKKKNLNKRIDTAKKICDLNFSKETSSFFLLTFDKEHVPANYEDTKAALRKFLRKLTRKGYRYSAVIHKGSKKERYHCHALIDTLDRKIVASLWDFGRVHRKVIYTDNVDGIVIYMANGCVKNTDFLSESELFSDRKNMSLFINSKGLIEPKEETLEGFGVYEQAYKFIMQAKKEAPEKVEKFEDYFRFCGNYIKANIPLEVADKILDGANLTI